MGSWRNRQLLPGNALGDPFPAIRAEGGGRQVFAVLQVADRILCPGVADRNGIGHRVAPDFDLVGADDASLGIDKFLVLSGNRKSPYLADVMGVQPAPT